MRAILWFGYENIVKNCLKNSRLLKPSVITTDKPEPSRTLWHESETSSSPKDGERNNPPKEPKTAVPGSVFARKRRIMKKLLSLFLFFNLSVSLFAQGDPLERLVIDRIATRNFEIYIERSEEHQRPTPKETGALVETLCAQLDRIFQKYSAKRVAEEMEMARKAAENEEKKPPVSSKQKDDEKPKSVETTEPDPLRVIPKCRIYIFNTKAACEAKALHDDVTPPEEYGGFFTTKTNAIYMYRRFSLQSVRETLLHETTHYYTYNFLPGGWQCYPSWFHEGLAKTYEKHYWTGSKFVIGVRPRVQYFDEPGSSRIGLIRFKNYLLKHDEKLKKPEPPAGNSAKSPARKNSGKKAETPIDPSFIKPFLETMFTAEQLQREGIVLKGPTEEINHRYAMYQCFGRYLLSERPDLLAGTFRRIAFWENENNQTIPRTEWFVEAWKLAAEKKPVTVEEIGRWVERNPLAFKWAYGDWQDMGDHIAGKATKDTIAVLTLRNPDALPNFKAFPHDLDKFQIGIVFNFVDENNYGVVTVNQEGHIHQFRRQNKEWSPGKTLGKTGSAPNRENPFGDGPGFQFAVQRRRDMIAVEVNKTIVATFPEVPNSCCGFYLGYTEAVFMY